MYLRPRRLTSGQTRAFGVGLIVVGLVLVWQMVATGSHEGRYGLLAPPALLVGPWLLVTGTLGARTLPESPLWHRLVAVGLGVAGFVWGVLR